MVNSHVKETDVFDLYEGDTSKPMKVEVTVKSSDTLEDGFIEYGRSVSSVSVTIHQSDDTDVTSEMLANTATVSDNVLTIPLDYPSTSGAGSYYIKAIITLDDGSTRQINIPTIIAY